jgi:hypothetical protein
LRESNGRKKGEGNAKNGNKYLAWAFIEAANFALRCVHSKRAGREDSAPTSMNVAMPTPLAERKAVSGQPLCEVVPGSPESLARGMLSRGFPANPGELTASRECWKKHQVPGARGSLHGKRRNPQRRETRRQGRPEVAAKGRRAVL